MYKEGKIAMEVLGRFLVGVLIGYVGMEIYFYWRGKK